MSSTLGAELIGKVLHGTYRLECPLGHGGMGVVYEASHLRLARRFAVKLLHEQIALEPAAMARFHREAQITSALGHDHIIEVVDFNRTRVGQVYIVMELLEGEDLARRLDSGALPLETAMSIFEQTADAIAAVHRQGIIHRDIKPQNIFLCRKPARDDFVKVLDFGISKVLGTQSMLTQARSSIGTPIFMPPEQLRSAADVDSRADIYALGAILYAMLAGRPPLAAESLVELSHKVLNETPSALSEFRSDLPDSIVTAVARSLSKKPEDRFASVGDFCAAIMWQPPPAASDARPSPASQQQCPPRHGPLAETATVDAQPPVSLKPLALSQRPSQLETLLAKIPPGRTGAPTSAPRTARWVFPTAIVVGVALFALLSWLLVDIAATLRGDPSAEHVAALPSVTTLDAAPADERDASDAAVRPSDTAAPDRADAPDRTDAAVAPGSDAHDANYVMPAFTVRVEIRKDAARCLARVADRAPIEQITPCRFRVPAGRLMRLQVTRTGHRPFSIERIVDGDLIYRLTSYRSRIVTMSQAKLQRRKRSKSRSTRKARPTPGHTVGDRILEF